jgi:two-component system response regulator AtoC
VIDIYVPPLRERRDEIQPLTDFFLARYSRRYNRPAHPLSEPLRIRFQEYDWPGNVRELENMIKRLVVLQDETLVMSELTRAPRPVPIAAAASAAASVAAAPAAVELPAGMAGSEASYRGYSTAMPAGNGSPAATLADTAVAVMDEPAPASASLADVAKQAALRAERIAISETLQRVHWNRRKAAQQLGVSYKTLLNKIKECGISRK